MGMGMSVGPVILSVYSIYLVCELVDVVGISNLLTILSGIVHISQGTWFYLLFVCLFGSFSRLWQSVSRLLILTELGSGPTIAILELSLAKLSAILLPAIPQCPGTHVIVALFVVGNFCILCLPYNSSEEEVYLFALNDFIALLLSVQMMLCFGLFVLEDISSVHVRCSLCTKSYSSSLHY